MSGRGPLVLPMLLALTCWAGMRVYASNAPVLAALLAATLIVGLAVAGRVGRWRVVSGCLLAGLAGFGGLPGALLALAAGGLVWWRPRFFGDRRLALGMGLALLLALPFVPGGPVEQLAGRFLYWSGAASGPAADAGGLVLPSVLASVREAQKLDWVALSVRCAGHPALLAACLLGFALLAWCRPAVLVFVPLWAVGLASGVLGNRFAMYAAPAAGLGLAGLGLLCNRRVRAGPLGLLLGLAAFLAPLLANHDVAGRFLAAPVLPPVYARTLESLGRTVGPEAWLWTWWDYGYAAQYYARRPTMADGARNDGRFLYSTALVHASDSPRQAAGVMRLAAAGLLATAGSGANAGLAAPWSGDPLRFLDGLSPQQARERLAGLRAEGAEAARPAGPLPPQYLVLSWENVRLSPWIVRHGLTDVAGGARPEATATRLTEQGRIDVEGGRLVPGGAGGGLVELAGILTVGAGLRTEKRWDRPGAALLLANADSRELWLLDQAIARSLLVRMLLDDPAEFAAEFELVLDDFPWNRVYRLRD